MSDYLFEQLKAQADTRSLDGQARLAELARPLLERLPEGVYRELLLGRLSEEVSIGRDRLERLLASEQPARQAAARPKQQRRARNERSGLVRRAIQTLLHFPGLGAGVPANHALSEVQQRGISLLCEILDISRQNPHINTAGLLERFRDRAEAPHLESLLTEEMLLEESGAALELNDCLERILASREGARLAELVARQNPAS